MYEKYEDWMDKEAYELGLISGYNQPCKYGFYFDGHAVYCENEEWENHPRKCCHTWYHGKDEKGFQDKDCDGFEPNPLYIKPWKETIQAIAGGLLLGLPLAAGIIITFLIVLNIVIGGI